MSDVTQILWQIESGDPSGANQLLPLVYDELRKLAAARLTKEMPGQTLQATALVHDAFIRLVDVENSQRWNSRGHFFAAFAEAMRRVIVDRARQKCGPFRGGDRLRVSLELACSAVDDDHEELLAVSDAIEALAVESPVAANLVKLRYFMGLSHQEAAKSLEISRATADRNWAYAKAFLYSMLQDSGNR